MQLGGCSFHSGNPEVTPSAAGWAQFTAGADLLSPEDLEKMLCHLVRDIQPGRWVDNLLAARMVGDGTNQP
jgi:hypothetical protein